MNIFEQKERENILVKANEAGLLVKELGGQILDSGTSWRRFNFIATLPTIDESTRIFEITGQEPLIIRVPYVDEIHLFKAKYVSFLTINNDQLKIEFGAPNSNGGWNRSERNQGFVYGFTEIPKVIDRGRRICMSSGYDSVHIPLDKLNDHRAIRVRMK